MCFIIYYFLNTTKIFYEISKSAKMSLHIVVLMLPLVVLEKHSCQDHRTLFHLPKQKPKFSRCCNTGNKSPVVCENLLVLAFLSIRNLCSDHPVGFWLHPALTSLSYFSKRSQSSFYFRVYSFSFSTNYAVNIQLILRKRNFL
jgi:hypothetical protein